MLQFTPECAQVITSLHAIMKNLPAFERDGYNPHFKSKFITFESILLKMQRVALEFDCSIHQSVELDEGGLRVTSTLLHKDGERVWSLMWTPIGKNDPQGAGSATTYAKRYGLSAMFGICDSEDDDGNSAQHEKATNPKQARQPPPKDYPQEKPWNESPPASGPYKPMAATARGAMVGAFGSEGVSVEQLEAYRKKKITEFDTNDQKVLKDCLVAMRRDGVSWSQATDDTESVPV